MSEMVTRALSAPKWPNRPKIRPRHERGHSDEMGLSAHRGARRGGKARRACRRFQDQRSTATISPWGACDTPVRGSQWAGRGLLYTVTRWRPLLSTTPTSDSRLTRRRRSRFFQEGDAGCRRETKRVPRPAPWTGSSRRTCPAPGPGPCGHVPGRRAVQRMTQTSSPVGWSPGCHECGSRSGRSGS